jgi:hypothetical protein
MHAHHIRSIEILSIVAQAVFGQRVECVPIDELLRQKRKEPLTRCGVGSQSKI